jgi:hypothetical protein
LAPRPHGHAHEQALADLRVHHEVRLERHLDRHHERVGDGLFEPPGIFTTRDDERNDVTVDERDTSGSMERPKPCRPGA